MRIIEAELVSTTPIEFGKQQESTKQPNETWEQYGERTWKERCHTDDKGNVYINPMAFRKALETAASRINESVPGKGKQKWGKYICSGIQTCDPVFIGIHVDNISYKIVSVPSDGKPSGQSKGSRVARYFPHADKWKGKLILTISDDTIPFDQIKKWLIYAGQFCGVGVYRPSSSSGGWYGKWMVKSFKEIK